MGLTIHFSGRLRAAKCLPRLIDEVKDIAEIHQWKYNVFETRFPPKYFGKKEYSHSIYGICFTPPGCETVSLCFLSNGRLVHYECWRLYIKSLGKNKDILFYGVSTKTQYAGIEVHKILILLLDHLSKKYFKNFKLTDEAQYWETKDDEILNRKFEIMTGLLQQFDTVLKYEPIKNSESFEAYFKLVLKKFHSQKEK